MEEESIVRLCTLHKPMHRLDHVGARGNLTRVAGIVSEHDDVFWLVSISLCPGISSACASSSAWNSDLPIKNFCTLCASLMHPRRALEVLK